MKSVSGLISDGRLLLVIDNVKDRVKFAVFDLELNRIRFIQTVPYVRANSWSLSESSGLIACVGWEDGMVSTFDTINGIVVTGFRSAVDADILIHEATIRILEKSSVHVFNLQGKRLETHRIPGEPCKDLGKYVISRVGDRYELLNSYGEHLSTFGSSRLGITSAALLSKGLVVAEVGGPITAFDENGHIIWQKASPNEFHPTHVAGGIDDQIHATHAHLPTLNHSILTVQSSDGAILAAQKLDSCRSVETFSAQFSSWIMGALHTFKFEDGKFDTGRIEQVKNAFGIED